jgi:hypothetical protein
MDITAPHDFDEEEEDMPAPWSKDYKGLMMQNCRMIRHSLVDNRPIEDFEEVETIRSLSQITVGEVPQAVALIRVYLHDISLYFLDRVFTRFVFCFAGGPCASY